MAKEKNINNDKEMFQEKDTATTRTK